MTDVFAPHPCQKVSDFPDFNFDSLFDSFPTGHPTKVPLVVKPQHNNSKTKHYFCGYGLLVRQGVGGWKVQNNNNNDIFPIQ